VFLWCERRALEPIVPLDLLNTKILRLGAIAAFLQSFVYFSGSLYSPLYIQTVIGDSPSKSGLTLIPQIFAGLIANIVTGQLLSRLGRYKPLMIAGSILLPLGVAIWVLTATWGNRGAFIFAGVIYAIGFSTVAPSLNVSYQNALPIPRMGVGTGTLQVIRSIGQTMGAAVIGALIVGGYSSVVASSLPPAASSLPPEVLSQLTDPQHVLVREGSGPTEVQINGVPQDLTNQVIAGVHNAIALGLRNGFSGMLVGALICAVTLIFFMPDAILRRTRSVGASAPD
jgi:MFS family permease